MSDTMIGETEFGDAFEDKDKRIHSLEAQLEAEKQERTVEIRARKTLEGQVKDWERIAKHKADLVEDALKERDEAREEAEQAEERWKNAEDANIKLCEQLDKARGQALADRAFQSENGRLAAQLEESDKFNDELMAKNSELLSQLEEAEAEIESRKKNAESRYHPMALLEEQNARLKKALECVYVWLANSQDNVKCKNNPFPDGIVKQTLQQLSNQGETKWN